jgi:hypothetical protein
MIGGVKRAITFRFAPSYLVRVIAITPNRHSVGEGLVPSSSFVTIHFISGNLMNHRGSVGESLVGECGMNRGQRGGGHKALPYGALYMAHGGDAA